GTDLVVRDGRLWMRGLDAPEPVDVVLRRIDADYADPLDLRSDSRLGVPGLVRAVRGGSVSVVNPLGTSVLENAGLLAHLPRLAQVVLGQDLALGSPATYWCGDDGARAHVLARLDTLVLKPIARGAGHTTVLGWTLDRMQQEELAARIAAEPGRWVGQEPVPSGTSGAAVLRTFAVAHRGSYHVMAGGLARVAPDAGQRVSSALGAVAKDVWVMSSQPYAVADPWVRSPDGSTRGGGDIGSETAGAAAPRQFLGGVSPRTAENLFWMGRYAERAGGTVRAMRAVVDRWDDFHHTPDSPGGRALAALVTALGAQPPSGPTTAGPQPDEPTTDLPDLRSLLLDRTLPGSVAWCTRRLAEAAAAVRDQLSADIWLPLASIERALADERRAVAGLRPGSVAAAEDTTGMRPVLDRMLEALLAVAGIEAESLVRDAGWRFLDAGRRLERAQTLVESLAATVTRLRGDDVDSLVLESVLIGHESIITYRRRNQARAAVATVLDLLLGDAGNPRSLAFQLDRLLDDLASIPAPAFPTDTRDRLLSDVTDLLTELDTSAVSAAVTEDGRRERLAEVLDSMRWRLRSAAEEIARVHFVHPAPSRTVGDTWDAESAALPTGGTR
ncbi:MAG TPA: circularly permuted type 2 ATP-grasp protein, partial [Cellulomonas sp.]